ncbi:hypothetical protein CEUSTIGMA_g2223.t1 [Chlamydomonas eustigma]|uniref:F-box domain-containing protein n=1 Tax=Chlamydomonas eustigma TaxID=1157962 RepID=A0A250WVI3_9CHLO|nr:hypothetical protein CEUSTIGMA_g2223.t1 [Chlamydomonas eustigma]|eukprot:GAX74776.1 hypothetical protein CEUSTIGMA_g2223.t1 [Chlamydomonas eustigma]
MQSSDSSDGTDFIDGKVVHQNYHKLALESSFEQRILRICAIRELTHCFLKIYPNVKHKPLLQTLYKDALTAVRSVDSRASCREAVAHLIHACERVLPQQKRLQLNSEHKKTSLNITRRKGVSKVDAHHADTEWVDHIEDDLEQELCFEASFNDLPQEIVDCIARHLDPLSLAAVACVSRVWRSSAVRDEVWEPWVVNVFPHMREPKLLPLKMLQQQQQQGAVDLTPRCHLSREEHDEGPRQLECRMWYNVFRAAVVGSDHSYWKGRRVFRDGQPHWIQPFTLTSWQSLRCGGQSHCQQRRVKGSSLFSSQLDLYMSMDKIITWVLGRRIPTIVRSENEEEDSGSDCDEIGKGGNHGFKRSEQVFASHLSRMRLWAG